tara:strand:+ start:416613 stop:417359 length:747 start_codon:yes stop_codon:yes gene_type:complete
MLKIHHYLDSTYLKTAQQAAITDEATLETVSSLIEEAIVYDFKLVMLRPRFVQLAKKMILQSESNVGVGTVIGFHEGTPSIQEKLKEAQQAINDGADELDFVINYTAFLNQELALVKEEVRKGTQLAINNDKIVKWIIEIAALTNDQIVAITQLIRDVVLTHFDKKQAQTVFVKSSTGFYKTNNTKPNGATLEAMQLIVTNAAPLQAKAAGGVRTYEDALKMIKLGVTRIGTSSAKALIEKQQTKKNY